MQPPTHEIPTRARRRSAFARLLPTVSASAGAGLLAALVLLAGLASGCGPGAPTEAHADGSAAIDGPASIDRPEAIDGPAVETSATGPAPAETAPTATSPAATSPASAPAPGGPAGSFHPTDLDGVRFFVESVRGLSIARCASLDCFDAGENAPLAEQYCDTEVFPDGCVRRWLDQSSYRPPRGFEPPEWTGGRDFGQDDHDKPGVRLDCLGGQPCVEGGKGTVQERSLEIEPDQPVGPIAGPFSIFLLARPTVQERDFYYLGFAGSELFQRVDDGALGLRIGFRNKIALTEPGSVETGAWHLLEVERDLRHRVRGLVDGWDRTLGQPVAQGDFFFRFLLSVSRGRAMHGQVAACLVVEGHLAETERQQVYEYFERVYGLELGDGSPPPKEGIDADLSAGLLLHWSFDEAGDRCRLESLAGPQAVRRPACPRNGPEAVAGRIGGALAFDGVDDGVRALGSTDELDQRFRTSMAAWVRVETGPDAGDGSTTADRGWRSIIDKRDALKDGWDLYLDPRNRPFLRIDDTTLEGETVLEDGTWHHLAGVYDGSRLLIYVDGRLDRSRVAGRKISLGTDSPLAVGINYGSDENAFRGRIDDVRVYGRALTAPEVEQLATPSEPAPNEPQPGASRPGDRGPRSD